jgi:hypothetical protein
MGLYLYVQYEMIIHLHIVMFQEFVKTLKEVGIDEITSPGDVQSNSAKVKHEPFSALDRFKPKRKKKEGV